MDTNVLVSALLTPFGGPSRILELISSGQILLLLDNRIFAEYREVLARPKFQVPSHARQIVLERLSRKALWITTQPLALTLPDKDDVMFVEVAVAGKAYALITGNKRHFPLKRVRNIKILSPREFLQKINVS